MIVTAFKRLYSRVNRSSPPRQLAPLETMNLGILRKFFVYVFVFCVIGSVFALAFLRGSTIERKQGFVLYGGLSPPQIPTIFLPLSYTEETRSNEVEFTQYSEPIIGEEEEMEKDLALEDFWMQDYDEKHTLERFLEEQNTK